MLQSASGGDGVCSGGCLLWGVSAPGVVLGPGGCLLPGVRGVPGPWGVSAPGGWSGGCLLWGGVSQHALRQTPSSPLWTEFLTHACENITLAQLRCGR